MAKQFSVNNTPATGTVAMYALITFLVAQGWVVTADSDGTTYSATGGQVTGSGSGAHGLANTNAWVALRTSDSTIFLVIQRGSVDISWRIKIASSAFSGGTPGATQVGSSTTEILWIGAGTDAAPTTNTLLPANGTYKQHLCADNASPWGFYMICPTNTTGAEATGSLVFDPIINGVTADTRQWVIWQSAAPVALFALSNPASSESNNAVRGWHGFGGTPSVVSFGAAYLQTSGALNNGTLGTNSNSLVEDRLPAPICRLGSLTAPVGWKGVSTMVSWGLSVLRSSMSTFNTGGTIDHVSYGTGGYVLDWPNIAPVV